jgi:hypothetical protein
LSWDDPVQKSLTTQHKNFIIVFPNLGGEGKSTTDLGFEMIKLGLKLALIDFNPQYNLDLFHVFLPAKYTKQMFC